MANRDERSESSDDAVVIPVASEQLEVGKRTVETGTVRVRKTVREREERIDQPLMREEVEVSRVTVDRIIDAPAATRTEGEVLIVPVQEEILVLEKRWVLREEVRIRKRRIEAHEQQSVRLQSEEVSVERTPAPPGDG